VAALQAVIPVARLSETEGSSNAVGRPGDIRRHRRIPHRRQLGRQLQLAPNRSNVFGPKRRLRPVSLPLFHARSLRDRLFRILHGRAPLLQRMIRMTSLYHGSPAHQKSSGKSRQLTPLFREKRLHCGHARSSRFESNRASPVPRCLRCPPI
jgi:hypothetical protein